MFFEGLRRFFRATRFAVILAGNLNRMAFQRLVESDFEF